MRSHDSAALTNTHLNAIFGRPVGLVERSAITNPNLLQLIRETGVRLYTAEATE